MPPQHEDGDGHGRRHVRQRFHGEADYHANDDQREGHWLEDESNPCTEHPMATVSIPRAPSAVEETAVSSRQLIRLREADR